ncbi:MAG TPA: hypothetical protein VFE01_07700 [Terracidiphilus sp.]|nr:hypothetical protein [Terracidiphilus sp.]
MIDIHAPHETVHTWRDFFIHIATIVVGLIIAIGLEQTVEAIHHQHQRDELTGQMREEAQQNLPVIRESISRLQLQRAYIQSLESALLSGKVAGTDVSVAAVAPQGGSGIFISPSRGTWATAQAAGLVALLPQDQAKLYARLDFEAEEDIREEDAMYDKLQSFLAECRRAGYDHTATGVSHLSVAHRNDLLFQLDQIRSAIENLILRLSVVEGGDEAIVAGVRSLNGMYPYQDSALSRVRFNSTLGSFYGAQTGTPYKELSTRSTNSQ